MRLGILGGSFDPVHNGHLALARACQQQAGLDEVWFMPTAVQPLKHDGSHATAADRVEMLRLAIAGEDYWRVCTLEVDRGGRSYTIDTLRQLHEELPNAELFFLVGSDVLCDVARWKEPHEIFRLATPLVVHRAGEPTPDLESLKSLCTSATEPRLMEMPATMISSREIRHALVATGSIDQLVPVAVAVYIADHGLYK